jgi:hypothetical protein
MITDEQIQDRVDALEAGDSNDAQIDGLLEIVRELQTERDKLPLDVKAAAIEQLDKREIDFLVNMLTHAPDYTEGEERMSLDELRAAYQDHYEAIWMGGDLTEDNERHEADDYHQGFAAGAAMVLEHLHRVFGIEPPQEEGA